MNQNAIYICISWYTKICWFPVKKCCCQQNSRGVTCDSYVFCIFFKQDIHYCRICVTNFRDDWRQKGSPLCAFLPPSPLPRLWAAHKMPILNRVKISRDLKVINTTHVALGEKDNSREVFVPKIKLNTEILRLFNYDNNSRCAISPLIKTRISSTLPFLSQINENEQPCW